MIGELKPCPSCASEAHVYDMQEVIGWSWYAHCLSCRFSSGPHETKAEAVAAWNRRAFWRTDEPPRDGTRLLALFASHGEAHVRWSQADGAWILVKSIGRRGFLVAPVAWAPIPEFEKEGET